MIYFDHNASAPVRPEVRDQMSRTLSDLYANPSSAHSQGQRARAAVEHAREQVAALLGARPDEVVFTSGGTEGDHAGLLGLAWGANARCIAVSAVEHHAIHGAADLLEQLGATVHHLPVDAQGRTIPAAVDELPDTTAVIAVMLANNETGVIQPVAEIAARARARGIRLLCDAVQAAGKIPIDIAALGADVFVVSGHKLGGPKGAGAMVVTRGVPFRPLFRGSGQERGRRAGTENLPGIVGLGLACELAARDIESEYARLEGLRARLELRLREALPDLAIHGETATRLPNTVLVSIPGARSDRMLIALDARGIAVSAGAACASGAVEPSPVLAAMGVPLDLAITALRLSMGRTTTEPDVDAVVAQMRDAAAAVRAEDAIA